MRLSRDAEGTLRSLGPVARRRVSRALDGLQRGEGDPGPDPFDARAARVRIGEVELRVVFTRDETPVALVVGIDAPGGRAFGPTLRELAADLGSDIRVAVRGLARTPAFTLSVLLTLAIGLGGTTSILGVLNTVYRGALPFDDADALVRLRSFVDADGGERVYNMSPRDFLALRESARAFTGVAAMGGGSLAILGDDGATRVSSISVSDGWADLVGVRPALGRGFTPDEEAAGPDARVALVSYAVWTRHLGGAPEAVGGTLRTADGPLRVVGVLPAGFGYPYDADVWLPGRFDPAAWQPHNLNVVARLAPGIDAEAARADVARVYGALQAEAPGTTPDDGVHVASIRADFIRDHADPLRALSAAVVFLLVLACVNVGNLLGLRMSARSSETTLRGILGASRLRIARLAATESLVLFVGGAVAGLGLAALLAGAAGALIPDVFRTQLDVPRMRFEPVVVFGALGFAVAAGLVTGGGAAWRASRGDLGGALRRGARGGAHGGRLQGAMVVSEVALALTLLAGSAALFRHFEGMRRADLGFETEGIATLQVAVDTERWSTPDARGALYQALETEIGRLPEVASVGIISVNPLCCGDWAAPVRAEGQERPADAPPQLIHHTYVTPGFFETVGVSVVRGRAFGPQDRPGSPLVVIVDQALAQRLWPGEDPIGKRIGVDREGRPFREVVGVIPTLHREGAYTESWYLPLEQEPTGSSAEIVHLVAAPRSGDPLGAMRRAVATIDPTLATFGDATLEQLRSDVLGEERTSAALATAFAAVGLLLACVGVYGLVAYRVSLQTREIGTRLALGASRPRVVAMVVLQGARLLAVGVALGLLASQWLGTVLNGFVVAIDPVPPSVLAALAGALAVALVASALVPALRVARVDPALTIRDA